MAVKTKAKKACELPGRQADIVKAIYQLTRRLGRSPTHREIAAASGIRQGNVPTALHALSFKGLVKWQTYVPGTLELVGASWGDWCGEQVYAAEMTREGMRLALILSFGGSGR